jgi:ABC-type sugar transport system ATPase subunit
VNEPLLEARGIVKTFPGVRALDGADLGLAAGEIIALVGENGAGKTTLVNVLAGVFAPDDGRIRLDGRTVHFTSTHAASKAGIATVFQELSLAPALSVAENILANRQPTTIGGLVRRKRLLDESRRMMSLFSLNLEPATPVEKLAAAEQQAVEILKALSQRPRVLILDEPTSSLGAEYVKPLFETIRRLKDEGLSVIYISHHLPEVFEIADRVTVLRDGRHVATESVADVTEQDLVRMMVGREIADMYGKPCVRSDEELFSVENASCRGRFTDVTLSPKSKEILGIAGLAGSGRSELARAIFGAEPLEKGRLRLQGRDIEITSPREAVANRVAYLTEDRKTDGLFLNLSVRKNTIAPSLSCFANRIGLVSDRAVDDFAAASCATFNVVCQNIDMPAGTLSGGNQQKLLLSTWVGTQPLVLIADEPTRGVDIGARSEIYQVLRELAARGMGIILISSDLKEILGLSDRILVMRKGRIAGRFDRQDATEEKIIACATGVELAASGRDDGGRMTDCG